MTPPKILHFITKACLGFSRENNCKSKKKMVKGILYCSRRITLVTYNGAVVKYVNVKELGIIEDKVVDFLWLTNKAD